ncbi:MAG: TolC family protein, partial [Myxococcota bacterium]|nr:TolC family protein [Myxococcota bacterium]
RAEELVEAVTARYQTGTEGQHGVLRLTVLRDQLADDLGDFARAEVELQAALRAALGGTDPGALRTPEELRPLAAPPAADWAALAAAHRPAIAAHRAAADTAGRAAELARVEARPDLQVWAGYRLRSPQMTVSDAGSDLVSMGVALPVPAGSRRRADGAHAAADAERQAAEARAASVEVEAAARAASAHARWRRAAAKTATLDQTLLPGARAALDTARGDFVVGRADFASLFEAETALLALERVRIQAVIDTRLARVALHAALGTDAPGSPP